MKRLSEKEIFVQKVIKWVLILICAIGLIAL